MKVKFVFNLFLCLLLLEGVSSVFAEKTTEKTDAPSCSNSSSKEELDNILQKYVLGAQTEYIKYSKEKNELVIFTHPSCYTDIWNAIVSFVLLIPGLTGVGLPIFYPKLIEDLCIYKENAKYIKYVSQSIGGCFLAFTAYKVFKIISNIKTRIDKIPYLTFDTNGLKQFNGYVFEWKNVETCLNTQHSKVERYRDGNEHTVSVEYTLSIADKFGNKLFDLKSQDKLLPIKYEEVLALFNLFLYFYGSKEIKEKAKQNSN